LVAPTDALAFGEMLSANPPRSATSPHIINRLFLGYPFH